MKSYPELLEALVQAGRESERWQWRIGCILLDAFGPDGETVFGGKTMMEVSDDTGIEANNLYAWRKVARFLRPWYDAHADLKPPFCICKKAVQRASLSIPGFTDHPSYNHETQQRKRAEWLVDQWIDRGQPTLSEFCKWIATLKADENAQDDVVLRNRQSKQHTKRIIELSDTRPETVRGLTVDSIVMELAALEDELDHRESLTAKFRALFGMGYETLRRKNKWHPEILLIRERAVLLKIEKVKTKWLRTKEHPEAQDTVNRNELSPVPERVDEAGVSETLRIAI